MGKVNISSQVTKFKWLKKRHCRISHGVVCLNMIQATLDIDLINDLTLHVKRRLISARIKFLSDKAYEKCFNVHIDDYQDPVIIVELFSRLKNMRTLIVDGIINTWIDSALFCNNSKGLEHITLFSSSTTTPQSTVTAIVKHCPNLKSFEVSQFADTNAALCILSEHMLPQERLNLSLGFATLQSEQAAHCVHALSRISGLYLHSHSDIMNIVGLLPYLTGMKFLTANSKDDHILFTSTSTAVPVAGKYFYWHEINCHCQADHRAHTELQ